MSNNKIEKLSVATSYKPIRKYGPVISEDIYNSLYEVIHDFQGIRLQWNNIIYPIISTLAGQPEVDRKYENETEINPVKNGLDGAQLYVDRLTTNTKDNGRFWNTDVSPNRPNTIYEQFLNVYKYVNDSIKNLSKILNSYDAIPDDIKERIGINIWDPSTPSLGTNYVGPNDESLDGRSLNNRADIHQIVADIFGVVPNTNINEQISPLDYTIDNNHSGVRTLPKTIRERLIKLENIHSVTDEQASQEPNHSHLFFFDDSTETSTTAQNFVTSDSVYDSGVYKHIFEIHGTQYEAEFLIRHSGGDGITRDVFKIYKAPDGTPNVAINGNLTVTGTLTTVHSEDLTVSDNVIELNNGETGAGISLGKAGILINRGTEQNVEFIFNESSDTWQVQLPDGSYHDILVEGTSVVTEIKELYRYSRVLLGNAGDFAITINDATTQPIAVGTLQDGTNDYLTPFNGWSRKYRLELQYSDNFASIDSSINATLKITLDDGTIQTFNIPQCSNLDSTDSNVLYISDLFDIDLATQDYTIDVTINNYQSGAEINLYRVSIIAFDTI